MTCEVHRSSLRRLICPAQDHFIFLKVLVISMTFDFSLTQMLLFLSLYLTLSILLSILVLAMLFRGAVGSVDGLVSSCGNHTDIRSIVPKRPQPTSPMPHHLIIVDTDIVFPSPNSRRYYNQRNANIPCHRTQH